MIHVRLLQLSNYSTNDHKRVVSKILLRLLSWVQRTSRQALIAILAWGFKDKLTKMDVEAFVDMLTTNGGPAKHSEKPTMPPKSFRGQLMSLLPSDVSADEVLEADRHKNLVVKGEDWVTACKLYRAATLAYMEMIDQDVPQCLRDLFDIIAQYDAENGNHMGAWENSRKRLESLEDELGH